MSVRAESVRLLQLRLRPNVARVVLQFLGATPLIIVPLARVGRMASLGSELDEVDVDEP